MTYINYAQGNIPIVLSIPHNGGLEIPDIPTRVGIIKGDYTGRLVLNNDIDTYRIGDNIIKFFKHNTKFIPYMVCNNVNRNHVDINRQKQVGCEHPIAENIWNAYHQKLKEYITQCTNEYGHCLLIDIHGNVTTNNLIEFGYATQLSDIINQSLSKSSLSFLNKYYKPIELIVGDRSLTEFFKYRDNSFKIVPNSIYDTSEEIRTLSSKNYYYNGGFITKFYSQTYSIDAIQIELSLDLRQDENYETVSKKIAESLILFYVNNYFSIFPNIFSK